MNFLAHLNIPHPIIQAPMAGVSTAAMAAAVSNAGGLGSVGIGNLGVDAARQMIRDVRAATDRAFNVNVFCHRPAVADGAREAAWIEKLRPHFESVGAAPPTSLREIYRSFIIDEAMLAMLVDERPAVVSFHFGLPNLAAIDALHHAGIILFATATNLAEAQAIAAANVDAIVAQGHEAGGHRGTFEPDLPDEQLTTLPLTRLLARSIDIPIIAAGGIMDGAGIAAALALGATAAQLGTAFVLCPESSADVGYRAAMTNPNATRTVMTRAISGRPARSLENKFTAFGESLNKDDVPDYPTAYDAGKSLHAAAAKTGEYGYGAQWAGQGFRLARTLPAGELVRELVRELAAAQKS